MVFAACLGGLCELVTPCFDCQHEVFNGKAHSSLLKTMRQPGHEVELALSPLAGLLGAAGYHTSVVVAGEEYYFSPAGITCSPKVISHEKGADQRIFVGISQHCGAEMLDFLSHHFQPGTYDLLRKNCNSFTDCALFFFCDARLDRRFRTIEQVGEFADKHANVVQRISQGGYFPNPRAKGFDQELLIQELAAERDDYDHFRNQTTGAAAAPGISIASTPWANTPPDSPCRGAVASHRSHRSQEPLPVYAAGAAPSPSAAESKLYQLASERWPSNDIHPWLVGASALRPAARIAVPGSPIRSSPGRNPHRSAPPL